MLEYRENSSNPSAWHGRVQHELLQELKPSSCAFKIEYLQINHGVVENNDFQPRGFLEWFPAQA